MNELGLHDGAHLIKISLMGLRRARNKALHMKRLCVLVSVVCVVAGTAGAQTLSAPRPKAVRAHAAKTPTVAAASNSDSDIRFSDPYAPPVGVRKLAITRFPTPESNSPADQGGMSFTAGRDSPDAPFTGGLKLRF